MTASSTLTAKPNLTHWAIVLGLAVTAATAADAQWPRLSLDASLGTGGGQTNGTFLDRQQAPALDAVLAAQLHPRSRGGIVVATNVSYHSAGSYSDVCMPAANGGCIRNFPSFTMFGALAGWETAGSRIRVATGFAYAASEHSSGALAFQGRIDMAIPIVRHVALVGSLRGTHAPNVAGDRFSFFGLGGGIRLY